MTDQPLNRRAMLRRGSILAAAGGLGLRQQLSIAAAANEGHPLAPRPGHFPTKAKHLIVFFMTGGLSHLDTFDYKPNLQRDHDKTVGKNKVLGSPYRFRPRGECGKMVSELFEHVGGVVDDFCFLHTVHGDSAGHSAATLGMHTGSVTIPLPSLGSWISYGLGTLNTQPAVVRRARRQGALQRLPGLGRELPARLPQGRAGDPRPRPLARRQEPGALGLKAATLKPGCFAT